MVLAMVPAAAPVLKNCRATSWPAPISTMVPYFFSSRLMRSAFSRVLRLLIFLFTIPCPGLRRSQCTARGPAGATEKSLYYRHFIATLDCYQLSDSKTDCPV